jgi:hypothetical protein
LIRGDVGLSNGPRITVSSTSIQLESIDAGGVQPFVFKIHNSGDSILEVKRISVSCGCVHLSTTPKQVMPGSMEEVSGYVRPLEGATYINEELIIQSNDESSPPNKVRIVGLVDQKNSTTTLPRCGLGKISSDKRDFKIRKRVKFDAGDEGLVIKSVKCNNSGFSAEVKFEDSYLYLDLTSKMLRDRADSGDFIVSIDAEISSKPVKIHIPCFVTFEPPLTCDMANVFFDIQRKGQATKCAITLSVNDDRINLGDIHFETSGFPSNSLKIHREPGERTFEVTFRATEIGEHRGKLIVRAKMSDNITLATLEIPLYAYVIDR